MTLPVTARQVHFPEVPLERRPALGAEVPYVDESVVVVRAEQQVSKSVACRR